MSSRLAQRLVEIGKLVLNPHIRPKDRKCVSERILCVCVHLRVCVYVHIRTVYVCVCVLFTCRYGRWKIMFRQSVSARRPARGQRAGEQGPDRQSSGASPVITPRKHFGPTAEEIVAARREDALAREPEADNPLCACQPSSILVD